ncbi:MAG: HAD hydrolase-like protein [Candidatus Liptonbacteria bacterium]|nr:HAD hydrolase-like protein [Candidatus Liptonbacteria bacterium]
MRELHPRKIVLVDFDHVIFNTAKLKSRHLALLRRFGFSLRHYKEAHRKMMKEAISFHPAFHRKHLTRDRELRKKIAKSYEQLFLKKGHYNFPGAMDFVKKLSHKYSLILLSYGYKDFQLKKFGQSGLKRFFENAIITMNLHKKKDLAWFRKRYGNHILIIDDSEPVIRAARITGVKAIRVKKGEKNSAYYKKLAKRIENLL